MGKIFCVQFQFEIPNGIYIIITKNIRNLLWNEDSGAHWTTPTQYFWPRVFGAPII